MMTQLSTLKARLVIGETDVNDDAFLTQCITHFSAAADEYCGRTFARTAAFEQEFDASFTNVIARCFPVESAASFHLKSDETGGWIAQTGVEYFINDKTIFVFAAPLGSKWELGRITYAGGYVMPGTTPGAGQTALPAAMEQACLVQCEHWFRRRGKLDVSSQSGDAGSLTFKPGAFLEIVRHTLDRKKRMSLV